MLGIKRRLPANRTAVDHRPEAFNAMRSMTSKRLKKAIIVSAVVALTHEQDGNAESLHLAHQGIQILALMYLQTHYQDIPLRVPRPVRPLLRIASFSDTSCQILFRFPGQGRLDRLKRVLRIPDIVTILDGHSTHVFDGEELLLFSLHRMAHATSMNVLINMGFVGRDITQWSRAWMWFIYHIWRNFKSLVQGNIASFVHKFPAFRDALMHKANLVCEQRGFNFRYNRGNFSIFASTIP